MINAAPDENVRWVSGFSTMEWDSLQTGYNLHHRTGNDHLGQAMSPGGHYWDYYPGTQWTLSRHYNLLENLGDTQYWNEWLNWKIKVWGTKTGYSCQVTFTLHVTLWYDILKWTQHLAQYDIVRFLCWWIKMYSVCTNISAGKQKLFPIM